MAHPWRKNTRKSSQRKRSAHPSGVNGTYNLSSRRTDPAPNMRQHARDESTRDTTVTVRHVPGSAETRRTRSRFTLCTGDTRPKRWVVTPKYRVVVASGRILYLCFDDFPSHGPHRFSDRLIELFPGIDRSEELQDPTIGHLLSHSFEDELLTWIVLDIDIDEGLVILSGLE